MGSSSWVRRVPRTVVDVVCSGTVHHIVWHRGALSLLHHDEQAERALAGLGGQLPACVSVLEVWRDLCGAARPLAGFDAPVGTSSPTRPLPTVERRYLESLPTGLRDLAAVAAMVRAQRRAPRRSFDHTEAPRVPPSLARRMRERVNAAVQASLVGPREQGARQRVEFGLRVVPIGEPVSLEAEVTPRSVVLRLALSPSWLVEVDQVVAGATPGVLLLACRGARASALVWEQEAGRLVPRLAHGWRHRDREKWTFTPADVTAPEVWWSVSGR